MILSYLLPVCYDSIFYLKSLISKTLAFVILALKFSYQSNFIEYILPFFYGLDKYIII